ncbi:alginate export family protein [Massilia sp. Root351]|uniref:alginate export family protein n=1 Tax=Massilia sp. Root351 TaxID=1736522 RepID=UPI000B257154|nr:alginate export family protein [Massilia sp. Root351]
MKPSASNAIRAGLASVLLGAAQCPSWALGEPAFALNGEARLRYDSFNNAQAVRGNDYRQTLFRGILGAKLHLGPNLRLVGEAGTGQVAGRRDSAGANFQNTVSLQQFYADASASMGSAVIGAALGRQEFADGPKQLLSVGDGPNIHRSWNGVRLYGKDGALRVTAFDLRATTLRRGPFDEKINHAERLQGLSANLAMPGDAGNGEAALSLDPFWLRTKNPAFRLGGRTGLDKRDTLGLRIWGRSGRLAFDWTLAHQAGRYTVPAAGGAMPASGVGGSSPGRKTEAWALFAVHSLALSGQGWKPRITARLDVASGGRIDGSGADGSVAPASAPQRSFNQLYASSNYLGEGQFLSLSNLVMVTPGLALAPTAQTRLSAEYGFARRYTERDAAYAGGMRAYAGTQNVAGHEIGGLLRVVASWSPEPALTLSLNIERFNAGSVLNRAGRPSGGYAYVGAWYRY